MNAFQVPEPEILTVKSLRDYLNAMEELWTDQDIKYLGEFLDQKFNVMYHSDPKGIGPAKIVHDGGLDFILLPKEPPCE